VLATDFRKSEVEATFMGALRFLFVLGTAFAVAMTCGRAAEHDVKRTFPVQPGCTLQIDTYRGSVIVTESDAAEIAVIVQMEIGGETDADVERVRSGLQLEMNAVGNTVAIRARNPRESRIRWVWRENEQIGLTYRVSVPRTCNVDVKTGTGSITIGNLSGRMKAQAEKGTLFLRYIEGSIDADVETGDVVVSRCSGAASVRLLSGTVRLGTIGGPLMVINHSGDVEVMAARAGGTIATEAGTVTVGFPREIVAETRVTAAGGDVVAKIPADARCRLEARAGFFGAVRCALPVQTTGGASKRKIVGTFNGGGPLISLRAQGGSVKIESAVPWFEEP
jgi:hypothetical protein